MKSSDLNNYFNGEISIQVFLEILQTEVEQYLKLHKKRGVSIPIFFNEDQEVYLNSQILKKLLTQITQEPNGKNTLAYIFDCLTLGGKVHYTDPVSTEIIFDFADIEACSQLNHSSVLALLNKLT